MQIHQTAAGGWEQNGRDSNEQDQNIVKARLRVPLAVTLSTGRALEKCHRKMNLSSTGSWNGRGFLESINLDYKNPKVLCTDRGKDRKMERASCNGHYLILFKCLHIRTNRLKRPGDKRPSCKALKRQVLHPSTHDLGGS